MKQEFKNKSKPGRTFLMSCIVSISFLVIPLFSYTETITADTAAAYEGDKPRLMVQPGHSQPVFMTAFSADGKYLVTTSMGKSIKLWDVQSGREIQNLERDIGVIVSLSFSGDYYRLLCASMDGKLMLWDIKTGDTTIISSDRVENITTMALSRDGNYALTMDINSVLSYWDIRNRRLIRNYKVRPENQAWEKNPLLLKPQLGKISLRMTFSKDSDIAIIGMLDDSIRFQDLKNGRGLRILKEVYSPGEFFSLSEDGKQLHIIDFNGIRATLPIDETSPIWHNYQYTIDHLLNEKPDKNLPKNFMEERYNVRKDRPENLSGFIYSEENGKILRFYHSNRWQFLDSASGIHLKAPPAPNEKITPLKFVPKQFHVLCSKEDGNLVLVDILNGSIIRRFERYSIPCTSVQFSRDASRITVKGKENQVLNKFLSLTSEGVSLQKIEQNFPLKSSWYSVWDLSTGGQTTFQQGLDNEKKSTSRSPLRKFFDALQQIQYASVFPTFIQKLRNFLENPEELQKVEHANQLWLRGKSSAAWGKAREALQQYMTPELKESFDDIELRFERMKAFLPTFANAVEMANHRKAVFTKDNLTFAVAKGNKIDLVQFKKMFPTVLAKLTYEDFKDENRFIQIFSQCGPSGISLLKGHKYDIQTMAFSKNSDVLLSIAEEGEIKLWDVEKEREIDSWKTSINSPVKRILFSAGEQYILLILDNGPLIGMQKNEKKQLFSIKVNNSQVIKANSFDFSVEKKMLIFGFPDGRCKLFDAQTGKEYGSLFSFIDGTWVIVNPNGRFDTNNLEDIKGLHWLMPDDPMKPWPLEIFMRDYYEPKLLPRLLAGETLPPIRRLMQLNRVQPLVVIKKIIPQPGNTARVTVEVEVGKNAGTYGGQEKETGVYDLRLFRDRQLVGYTPGIEKEIEVDPDTGTRKILFPNIKLPAKDGIQEVEFSAYAFNVDRVKSKTHFKTYKIPADLAPVKGNAYLVTVGVNAYENPQWDLQYAANDAKIIRETLVEKFQKTGEFKEIISIPLISDYKMEQGNRVVTENKATKRNFKAVLDLLSGKKVDKNIIKAIPNAGRIREANPEDLVFISFSSHGKTDKKGNFYFFPYDIGNALDMDTEDKNFLNRCISSDEISLWLRDVDAGDMVMIVDACYSAATVEQEGFKPGPMGNRGLGQLAYNKGMYILAASQADDVALESELVKHGLLTYALIYDGIEEKKADFKPKDRRITISEWLEYGEDRVPILYEEIKKGKLAGFKKKNKSRSTAIWVADKNKNSFKKKYEFQKPRLFNFKKRKSDVTLLSSKGE